MLTHVLLIGCAFGQDKSSSSTPTFDGADAKRSQIAVQLEPVAKDMEGVTDIQFLPGSSTQMVVLQKEGVAWVFDLSSGSKKRMFERDVVTRSECGLLGIGFHPKFPEDNRAFINYCVDKDGLTSRIAEVKLDSTTFVATGERTIMEVEQPYANHDAGQVLFGPDGYLYIGWGDGGSGGDPKEHGQDPSKWLGSMLRIDVSGTDEGRPYQIPEDNPFVGRPGFKPETYAWGLRNPWRFSWDQRDRLVVADVGQNKWEEVDIVLPGDNLGWDIREGRHCFEPPNGCKTEGLTDPVYEYGHDDGISITGGYVYLAKDIPALTGKYVFGDFGTGRIWAIDLPKDRSKRVTAPHALGKFDLAISTFGRDAAGRVYVGDYGSGTIYRLKAGK